MWIIYHGYYQTSTPLLAALVHQYLFPPDATMSRAGLLPLGPLEEKVFRSWQEVTTGHPLAALSFMGVDCYGNKIFVLGQRRFVTILKRTVQAGLDFTHNKEPVLWVDTSVGTNFPLVLGTWLVRSTTWPGRGRRPSLLGDYKSYQRRILRAGESLTRRGIGQAVPRLRDLIITKVGSSLC